MRKTIFFLFTFLLISVSISSKNITDYFIDMPSVLMPTFGSSYRVELVENFKKSGKDTVQNLFGTQVKLLSLDTVYQHIRVQITKSSRFEMQLLSQNNDTVIGIINTVCAPICSSYIKFFDKEWKEVRVDFPKFDIYSWTKPNSTTDEKKFIDSFIKTSFVEFNFNPKEKTVEVTNNSLKNLNAEDQDMIRPFFIERKLIAKWSDDDKKMIENRVDKKVIHFRLKNEFD